MNKSQLIDAIAAKSELTKTDSEKALNATLAAIKETLSKKESLILVGFGTFSVADRAARTGRNPKTGEPIDIPAAQVVKFKVGTELKNAVDIKPAAAPATAAKKPAAKVPAKKTK